MVQRKKKGGWVYGVESTRKDGRKEIYTGMTRRSPSVRWNEEKPRKSKKL
jgi:hypothetical protein